jgi:hypothetical protein
MGGASGDDGAGRFGRGFRGEGCEEGGEELWLLAFSISAMRSAKKPSSASRFGSSCAVQRRCCASSSRKRSLSVGSTASSRRTISSW